MNRIDPHHLERELSGLDGWEFGAERGGVIRRRFLFDDFAQAFGFMTMIAIDAERRAHHPEWTHVYNRVDITWTTHDVGGLSTNDFACARLADRLHRRLTAKDQARAA